MAECDLNYERLMRLFPKVREEESRCISLLAESAEESQRTLVELRVVERGRYTTLIQLVQKPQLSWGRSPNMRIRMYTQKVPKWLNTSIKTVFTAVAKCRTGACGKETKKLSSISS